MQRFFGLIVTASNLGVIQRADTAEDVRRGQQTYRLGSRKTLYAACPPSESKRDQLLQAAREEERSLTAPASTPCVAGASTPRALADLIDYGSRRAKAALRRIGNKCGALPFHLDDASGYCIDWLTRKMAAARLVRLNLHQSDDWSRVDKESLQSMSADSGGNLESVPHVWAADQVSRFFTGRADWRLFASAFPCLWGEVADELLTKTRSARGASTPRAADDARARAIQIIKSETFLQVVRSFRETEGIAPHPAVAFKLAEERWSRARETPRATMPRKKLKAAR